MHFSICVPTLNEEKYIGILLKSLVDQTYKNFEVIIADGNSKDKTVQTAQGYADKLALTVLNSPQRGISFQRNYAAQHAHFENLIFFDADVKPEPDFLDSIARYLEKHQVEALTSWNKPLSKNIIDKIAFGFVNLFILSGLQKINPVAIGTFIYIKKPVFEKLKGFNEQLSFGEDAELIKRLHQARFSFTVLRKPAIPFSVRRLNKEGRATFFFKTAVFGIYYLLFGKMPQPKKLGLKYEFGNHI